MGTIGEGEEERTIFVSANDNKFTGTITVQVNIVMVSRRSSPIDNLIEKYVNTVELPSRKEA